jgi:hypothetical protein
MKADKRGKTIKDLKKNSKSYPRYLRLFLSHSQLPLMKEKKSIENLKVVIINHNMDNNFIINNHTNNIILSHFKVNSCNMLGYQF